MGDARQRVVAYAARSASNRLDLVNYCFQVTGNIRIDGQRVDSIEPGALPGYLLLGYSDVVVARLGLDSLD